MSIQRNRRDRTNWKQAALHRRHSTLDLMRRFWPWFVLLLGLALWHDAGFTVPAVFADDAPAAEAEQPAGEDPAGGEGDDHSDTNHVKAGQGAGHGGGGHVDPVAPVLVAIVLVLLLAKLGGDLFERMSLPAVLGELTFGVVLGNFALLTGSTALDAYFLVPEEPDRVALSDQGVLEDTIAENVRVGRDHVDAAKIQHVLEQVGLWKTVSKLPEGVATRLDASGAPLDEAQVRRLILARVHVKEGDLYNPAEVMKMLAGIGVILLLFEVGLESSVRGMMSVGASSLLVAVLGVIAPMLLGYGVSVMILPDTGWSDWEVPAFIGATLCATSVGITARVLKDLGRSQDKESQIILGAAVIDDVLGLIVLAVVSGVIVSEGSADGSEAGLGWQLTRILLLAFGFIFGALLLGALQFPRAMFSAASYLRGHGLLVATALVICFGFSFLANYLGLATIVGAFAAGLILEGAHYEELGKREDHDLEEALAPISALLVPIFFVQMGTQVDLTSFANPNVWGLAAGITVMAVLGKQVCSLGVREEGLNKTAIGLGMIPRGEVGLIFANEGRKLVSHGVPVIDKGTYSAVVVMVMITTMVTPPLLKWSMTRNEATPEPGGETPGSDS